MCCQKYGKISASRPLDFVILDFLISFALPSIICRTHPHIRRSSSVARLPFSTFTSMLARSKSDAEVAGMFDSFDRDDDDDHEENNGTLGPCEAIITTKK